MSPASQEGGLTQTEVVQGDASFWRLIPAESVSKMLVNKQTCLCKQCIHEAAETTKNLVHSCAAVCSLLHELPMREFKCIQSMLTEISSENITICMRS